ncbi:hypothetical protein [Methylobacterium sp. XJLW]|uniref:hypothetical protein n=1 Tax=Methylobacterium sp. XJLW TaxID=739141 RepID=UPI00197B3B80|nr:hypothetical protein [Methylobacterium sp. XJLW]
MQHPRSANVAHASGKSAKPTSGVDEGRQRCGDAGRRAATARAHRYMTGLEPLLEAIMRHQGRSAQTVAAELTRRAVRKPRGGMIWTSADAQRLLRRLSVGTGMSPR